MRLGRSVMANRGVVLYRAILKVHRRSLPPALRTLGDEYVRAEFRLHKKVEKPEALRNFFGEWERYLETIKTQNGRFGKDLDQQNMQALSDAQKTKLQELKAAAQKSVH